MSKLLELVSRGTISYLQSHNLDAQELIGFQSIDGVYHYTYLDSQGVQHTAIGNASINAPIQKVD